VPIRKNAILCTIFMPSYGGGGGRTSKTDAQRSLCDMNIDVLCICNIIFLNMYSMKCWFRKVVLPNDIVEFQLPSHRKYKSTEAFMFSGGLSVYWILYRGEADAIIIIIIYQKWQVDVGCTYTVVLEQCPIADSCSGLPKNGTLLAQLRRQLSASNKNLLSESYL
jgi:hypothetical protein